MSKAAFSVKAFGYYLIVLGIGLTLVPNLLLSVFGMPPTTEVWVRVVGVLVFNIGIYYLYAARCEATAFFQAEPQVGVPSGVRCRSIGRLCVVQQAI